MENYLENYCPKWGKEHIDSYFCAGCGCLDSKGECAYTAEEKKELYELTQRLKTGL
jgi:hypothetical protein